MSQNFVHLLNATHGPLRMLEVKYRRRHTALLEETVAGWHSRGNFLMEGEVGLRRKWTDKEKKGGVLEEKTD